MEVLKDVGQMSRNHCCPYTIDPMCASISFPFSIINRVLGTGACNAHHCNSHVKKVLKSGHAKKVRGMQQECKANARGMQKYLSGF